MARRTTRSLSAQRQAESTASKPLTPKQEEVVALAHQGLSVAQAAEKLGVAESNVYNHAKRIREKGVEVTFAKNGGAAAPAEEDPPAATNGTSADYMAEARRAFGAMITDSEAYLARLRSALGGLQSRLQENEHERSRLVTEAEELSKEASALERQIKGAEDLHSQIVGTESVTAAT
jgi:DNA-binding CsgD family transcriptional regulator